MRDLDEKDLVILEMLSEDARRSYADIGDAVDLSAPAISDRVARLREDGVIERFTLEVNRNRVQGGVPVLVELVLDTRNLAELRADVLDTEATDHVFSTADGNLVFQARVPHASIHHWLTGLTDDYEINSYDVTLLSDVHWSPSFGGTGVAAECAECGSEVTSEGVSVRIDDEQFHFCCQSCRRRFENRYDRLGGVPGN